MKKLMSPIAIVLSLFLILPVASAATDVPESHQFYDEINYLVEKGVLKGYPDGTIRPNDKVTRAHAAVMIGRLKGLDGTKKATLFRDVPTSHSASGYIAEAAKAGYIRGYPDGTYQPNKPLSRSDMAVIVERVFKLAFTFNHSFKDVPQNAHYSEAVSKILAANITIGYPDNTFRPRQEVTRGQFSAFLARALEPKFKNEAVIPHSYQKDKTKTYTYQMSDGTTAVHRFADVPDRDGLVYGFMWTVQVGGDTYEYLELENRELFAFGYPYSEYDVALVYPVQVGKTFNTGLGDETIIHTITGVNKTVETEYKTFTNATEVTTASGLKYYMVEGFATVKSVNAQGRVEMELVNVR